VRIQFYEQSLFEPLVAAMHELDEHYFGESAASRDIVAGSLVRGLLSIDSGVKVVALDQGMVAGLATVSLLFPAPEQRGQLFMKDLFVCKRWRGLRVGEQVMQFLAAHAVKLNCVRFDWTTEETNPGAMAFYARLGAHRVKEKVYYRLSGSALLALANGELSGRGRDDA
jgi:GNAT superfamily N-acetyltransferase